MMGVLRKLIRRFGRARDGAVAIEFAFVFPLLLIISVGSLEIALLMFEWHNSTEATRRGVREAVIQDPVVALADISGTPVTCSSTGGTVSCSGGSTVNDASIFTDIFDAMSLMLPELSQNDIEVSYMDTGITTNGTVTPTVTVSIKNQTYRFFIAIFLPGFDGNMSLPSFRSTRVMATLN